MVIQRMQKALLLLMIKVSAVAMLLALLLLLKWQMSSDVLLHTERLRWTEEIVWAQPTLLCCPGRKTRVCVGLKMPVLLLLQRLWKRANVCFFAHRGWGFDRVERDDFASVHLRRRCRATIFWTGPV